MEVKRQKATATLSGTDVAKAIAEYANRKMDGKYTFDGATVEMLFNPRSCDDGNVIYSIKGATISE